VYGQNRVPELQYATDPQHIQVGMILHSNAMMFYLLTDKEAGAEKIECRQMG
jgi:hypothetical protein